MANISQITINGSTYDIKDSVARSAASAGLNSIEVVTSLPSVTADNYDTNSRKILLMTSGDSGTHDIYDEYICVSTTTNSVTSYFWERLGSTDIDISGFMTADGGGHTHTVTIDAYTPEGTVSSPSITVTPTTSNAVIGLSTPGATGGVSTTTDGVSSYTPTGSITITSSTAKPTVTAALDSAPTFTGSAATITHTHSASTATALSEPTVSGEKLIIPSLVHSHTVTVSESSPSYTPQGTISKPTITVTAGGVDFVTSIEASFVGTSTNLSHSHRIDTIASAFVTALTAALASNPTFTGTAKAPTVSDVSSAGDHSHVLTEAN